ncbi:MAG: SdpI family protein [Thermoanaerobaculia bacterium]
MIFQQPFAIPAAIFFVLSLPLVLGLIPRNRLYGFRTARTMASDATWFRVNRFAGICIMIASAIYCAVGVERPYDRDFSVWLQHLGAFAIPLAAALILSAAYAKRS